MHANTMTRSTNTIETYCTISLIENNTIIVLTTINKSVSHLFTNLPLLSVFIVAKTSEKDRRESLFLCLLTSAILNNTAYVTWLS